MATILLDTCAAIWIGNREPMAPAALQIIRTAARTAGILVSAVTGWEIGLATARPRDPLVLAPTARLWLADLLARPGQRIEQRALARVGIADQRGGAVAGHASGSTAIAPAWARRSATVIRPMVTASGSRPAKTPR